MFKIDVMELTDKIAKLNEDNENLLLDYKEAENLNEEIEFYFRQEGIIENFIPFSDDEDPIQILEENYYELIGRNWYE